MIGVWCGIFLAGVYTGIMIMCMVCVGRDRDE